MKYFLYLHISILLAGFTGVSGKLIQLREGVMVWYRMLFTVLLLILISLCSRNFPQSDKKRIFRMMGVGFLLAVHWLFFFGSIKASNVSVGVVCYALIGFFSALLEPLLLKRKFSWLELGFSLITIAGILLLFTLDFRYRLGIILGSISTLFAALFTIGSKSEGRFVPAWTLLFYEMLGGFLGLSCLMPLYLWYFSGLQLIPSGMDFGYLLLLAFFCTIGLYWFQIRALAGVSAFTVNISYNLEPVYSIILAMILFQEHHELSWSFYLSLFLIISAVGGQSIRTWLLEKKKAGS